MQANAIVAIGVNCTPPRFVPQLLRSATAAISGREDSPLLVCYPNSGEGWINQTGKWDGDSDLQGCDLGQVGRSWVDAGAKLVGGCCRWRTLTTHIFEAHERFMIYKIYVLTCI